MLFRSEEVISTVRVLFFRKVVTDRNSSVHGSRERRIR
jgi:hypothetical protein